MEIDWQQSFKHRLQRKRVFLTRKISRFTNQVNCIRNFRLVLSNEHKLITDVISDFNHKHILASSDVYIRFMSIQDFLKLRKVKNRNRSRFFYSNKIGYIRHFIWFAKCRLSFSDAMLILCDGSAKVGCLGLRLQKDSFELYNVMRLEPRTNFKQSPAIGNILQGLCTSILTKYSIPITAAVLLNNPALTWYYRNGFQVCSSHSFFLVLVYKIQEGEVAQ